MRIGLAPSRYGVTKRERGLCSPPTSTSLRFARRLEKRRPGGGGSDNRNEPPFSSSSIVQPDFFSKADKRRGHRDVEGRFLLEREGRERSTGGKERRSRKRHELRVWSLIWHRSDRPPKIEVPILIGIGWTGRKKARRVPCLVLAPTRPNRSLIY